MPTSRPSRYPEPFVINNQIPPHKQTFIILHDRGSSATAFGPAILFRPLPPFNRSGYAAHSQHQYWSTQSTTLYMAFPHAKFVFPTASMLRATAFTESVINQWLDEETRRWRAELPIPGLRDTVRYMHGLIQKEIDILDGDAAGVVVGGMSQGCAAALISALLWEGDPLGGCIGLCGWLPFAEEIMDATQPDKEDENEAPTRFKEGINRLREKLDVPASSERGQDTAYSMPDNTPLFIAHGIEDKTVPVTFGRQMVDSLKSLGWSNDNIQWKEYPGLVHNYSEGMLSDMVKFLSERLV
ncbi:acyl-protein thioesterase 1,2, putative [Talaromyces stipitatus ATCC 10500]|uniref:Acyl-protein thioesterase 1,2, putative n=1 Tax=Talaromyces stipitatus (strain ATCC 10500 / CBS 375.48 / QM 6759 / NRRL 1006) TaxID=441959 RepID=B8MS33_TALSN|nr:acyl-protein thioesterase 1,2, putative [Talaromyces stipitatus ATCC 10500]EED12211.1 acyl-protein thioesterase 1,2, putative [Talaromyces stipitatus ATCC 10500]